MRACVLLFVWIVSVVGSHIEQQTNSPSYTPQAQSLGQQRKVWRLERRPAWEIEVLARTYTSVDPAPKIEHDLAALRTAATAELLGAKQVDGRKEREL